MSRKYFRAIDVMSKEWVVGFYVCLHDKEHKIYDRHNNYWYVIPETVAQFTDLNDKYGNEICEYDIVRKTVGTKEMVGVVEYSDGAFGVRFTNGSNELLCFSENCCEILGNVFDNPEMLSE